MADPGTAASVGPGWEYYLDRLVTAHAGGDVGAIAWEPYPDEQGEHYRTMFG